ncbi:LPXTG cell wall anchor domain-containing protein [Streptomyces sp. P9(2023)]|uniref:LPXTG cell wall anchor domain-containing protein n=1 Tax=Streptomyces sp. P9(2023) TaxID=3064394 RepID=UPI0028F40DE2|nr:LPXTG cell wall anchor domain-containing protein [Streptomyces sp. P9(2023)]MDT9690609.1 LPXTG cell wall anchor domain-containing protein [Streptomyces sp. P9(2023)]
MKIRRILATAVAAAVTTPVVFLSAAPAFADTKPAAPAQTQEQQPTIDQLKKDVEAAQKAYDAALLTVEELIEALEAFSKPEHELQVALAAAKTAAAEAATKKTAADAEVVEAQAALDALAPEATPEEKAAAEQALTDAKTAAAEAATAKTAADAEVVKADTKIDDERVATARKIGEAQKVRDGALKTLNAAKEALKKAEEEAGEEEPPPYEDCFPDEKFTSVVTGLPSKVVAGTTVEFKLTLTNGTERTIDEAYAFVALNAFDEKGLKPLDKYLDLEWNSGGTWNDVPVAEELPVGTLKSKTSADIKLRLKVDADTPAGQGITFSAGDFWNEDGTCGGTPDLTEYEFDILAKGSTPGKVEDAKGTPGTKNTTQQGATSTTPVTNGTLAKTGSSDANAQLALAGAAAVAIGAGAMIVVRRRKAGADA